MAVTINGDGVVDVGGNSSSAAKVRLYEDTDNGTNYIDLIAPASVTSNQVLTLPNATATVAFDGPAFSAYQSSAQTLSSLTYTKIQLQTEEFDTANCFDSTTNYRFTPNVAGYYSFSASMAVAAFITQIQFSIYKNGSIFKQGFNNADAGQPTMSALIYLNGTTDYVELYGWLNGGQALVAGAAYTYFQGFLARAA